MQLKNSQVLASHMERLHPVKAESDQTSGTSDAAGVDADAGDSKDAGDADSSKNNSVMETSQDDSDTEVDSDVDEKALDAGDDGGDGAAEFDDDTPLTTVLLSMCEK